MVKKNFKNLIILLIIITTVLGSTVFLFPDLVKRGKGSSKEEVAKRTVEYINENFLQEGVNLSLVGVVEESGIYKMTLKMGEEEFPSYVTLDGKLLFPQAIDLESKPIAQEEPQEEESTIGNFLVSGDEICKENEKPLVYFFGSEGCSHCQWEHPVIKEVAEDFKDYVSFHDNMDSEADFEIFQKYSTGGIPSLVLGCKYYREGSGERSGKEEEKKTLAALICKLTENQPTDICNTVLDLINQISD